MERMYVVLSDDEEVYVERPEARRIRELLPIITELKEWTPLAGVARRIGSRSDQTVTTIRLLKAAQRIEISHYYGREIIALAPIIKYKKGRYNKRKNAIGHKFMRAPIYIKKP